MISPEELENRISNVISFLKDKGVEKIVVLTTIPTTTLLNHNTKMKVSNAWIKSKSNGSIDIVIDTSSAFYNGDTVNASYFPSSDGVHPNDLGKQVMSKLLDDGLN